MRKPKWIIQGNNFRLAMVELHMEMKTGVEPVKGGGYFHLDQELKEIYLYGQSVDFGQVSKEEVLQSLDWPLRLELNAYRVYFSTQCQSTHMEVDDFEYLFTIEPKPKQAPIPFGDGQNGEVG